MREREREGLRMLKKREEVGRGNSATQPSELPRSTCTVCLCVFVFEVRRRGREAKGESDGRVCCGAAQ